MKKLFFVIIVSCIVYFVYSNWAIQVTKYTIESEEIPTSFKGYKIAHISDLHNRNFGEENNRLLKKINKQNPDIVVLTGDMVSSKDTNFDVFFHVAEQIAKEYKTYYIVGNHEQALEKSYRNEIDSYLKSIGITILDNDVVSIEDGESQINLYGIWYHLMYYKNAKDDSIHFGVEQMNKIIGHPKEGFNIGLIHNPVYFETYADWGMDLVLSGHMHGGIIRIPFVGGLLSPEIAFFPTYDAGYFTYNESQMVISRGLGDSINIPRLFNTPELVIIELR